MSKILIIGDMHMKPELPYASLFEDERKGEWAAMLDTLVESSEGCSDVVFCGDNLNSKNNSSVVLDQFVTLLKRFGDKQVHLITGNHDASSTFSAIDFLKNIGVPNWHVYTQITEAVVGGKKCVMLPYHTYSMVSGVKKEDSIERMLEALPKADILFAHHGVSTALARNIVVGTFDEIVLPTEFVQKQYNMTFHGHIHTPQHVAPGVQCIGSLFTSEVGEHVKYIYKLDTETSALDQIDLPVRGIYAVTVDKEGVAFDMPKNSIVKALVTNKEVDIKTLEKQLKKFDAHVIVEKYPDERKKVPIENGELDLSTPALLRLFAVSKGEDPEQLLTTFNNLNK